MQFVEDFVPVLESGTTDGDVIIADENIVTLYAHRLGDLRARRRILPLPATEEQKSYAELIPVIDALITEGFGRDNTLVALGGGVIQDVTSFVSSILYRGVPWTFVPTTLLAQGDSCIGSKSSINFGRYKNQLGGFNPPKEIVIDLGFVRTLPDRELRSGLGEMAHYFPIAGEQEFAFFAARLDAAFTDRDVLASLVRRSLDIKRRYVELDEFDRGPRQVFNYGHSFGHALESVTSYRIPHGIAVAYGMDMANFVSVKLGLLDAAIRERIRDVLCRIWESLPLGSIEQSAYEEALRRDKKNRGGELGLILAHGFGDVRKKFVALDGTFSQWLAEYFAAHGRCHADSEMHRC